ncbi:SAM-dependent methyltransferase [Pyxidicoccus xibeiensis]|uniref:SAM-dependent methyltransferase n=1 Tax=Pyxidicoccus xibeiensis TaxID=2906759 RepID=UPI0020A71D03|nr:SAM-dependent methyltransferase [Pyxidicoccus xibeiensis]MCP3140974.1 SAM-dependent methyltransferase [Pyxidicoccus xibeiensis]
MATQQGSLVIAGTGIQWAGQTTHAARTAIEEADRVLFAVVDPWTVQWLRGLKPSAESLPYSTGNTPRRLIYAEMVRRILAPVREGFRVCAVFYGHPGVLHTAAHEALRQARAEGFPAQMLPGISFLDCLYADLGVDPGRDGFQVHEATDFLIRGRAYDAHSPLVLSQIAAIGNTGFFDATATLRIQHGLRVLSEVLRRRYPASHEAIIYEAAVLPIQPPRMTRVTLEELPAAAVTDVSTLYVPPLGPAPVDEHMLALLGMASGDGPNRSTQKGTE